MKIKFICPECGSSTGVLIDAFAHWDEAAQDWKLHDVYEDLCCNDCGATNLSYDDARVEVQ